MTDVAGNAERGEYRRMTDDLWSLPEMMRAVQGLTLAVEKLTVRIDNLGADFLRKDVADTMRSETLRRFEDVGNRIVDVEADLARFRKETADELAGRRSTLNAYIPAFVVALVSGGVAIAVAVFTHLH